MSDTKTCPYCGEEIKVSAIKCKHCHSMLSKEGDELIRKSANSSSVDVQAASKAQKPIWKQWWIWAISIFVIFILIVVVSSGNSDETVTPPPSTKTSSEASEQKAITEPDSTEQAKSTSNSRSNPASLNETFVVEKDDWWSGIIKYEVTLLETVSGNKAWEMVRAANRYNSAPDTGKEYILAKFRVKILSTEEDMPYDLNHAKFNVVSSMGVEYTGFHSVAGLNPSLRADLYEGAEHEGWTYFLVDIDDPAPLAVMDRTWDSEIWFKLRH